MLPRLPENACTIQKKCIKSFKHSETFHLVPKEVVERQIEKLHVTKWLKEVKDFIEQVAL